MVKVITKDLGSKFYKQKGYVQEVVDKYRALVRKRLMPVDLKGPPPAAGTTIRLNGKDAGEMRSSQGSRGIALLRLEQVARAASDGTPLLADGTEVVPDKPDWVNF